MIIAKRTSPEVILCEDGIAWLAANKWGVDQEVVFNPPGSGTRRMIDLVIARGETLGIVEAKVTLSAHVIAQAQSLRPWCSVAYVLVNAPADGGARQAFQLLVKIAKQYGVGILTRTADGKIAHELKATANRQADLGPLGDALAEHRHTVPAGSSGAAGMRWSRKQDRWQAVREHVREHPGDTAKLIKRTLKLSKADFLDLLRLGPAGRIIGVECRQEHGMQRFYATTEATT